MAYSSTSLGGTDVLGSDADDEVFDLELLGSFTTKIVRRFLSLNLASPFLLGPRHLLIAWNKGNVMLSYRSLPFFISLHESIHSPMC